MEPVVLPVVRASEVPVRELEEVGAGRLREVNERRRHERRDDQQCDRVAYREATDLDAPGSPPEADDHEGDEKLVVEQAVRVGSEEPHRGTRHPSRVPRRPTTSPNDLERQPELQWEPRGCGEVDHVAELCE